MIKLLLQINVLLLSSCAFGQVIGAFPYTENFESQTTGSTSCTASYTFTGNTWQNASDPAVAPPVSTTQQTDWIIDIGGTPSSNTGPGIDHTLGTAAGKYAYVETSGCNNQQAELVSPWMDFTSLTTPRVKFWYHAYGATMGILHVDAVAGSQGTWINDVVSPITGNVDLWQEATAYLPAFAGEDSVRVRFRFITGSSFTSDIALDDITVDEPLPYDLVGLGFLPGGCGLGATAISVQFFNGGTSTLFTGDTITFNFTDGTNTMMEDYILTADLLPTDTITYTFTGMPIYSTAGTVSMEVWSEYTMEMNSGNDTILTDYLARESVNTYPYLENFESGTNGYYAYNSTDGAVNGTWAFGTPMKTVIQGAASGVNAFVNGGLNGDYLNNDNSRVDVGPCFDFTNVGAGAHVSMKLWTNAENSWDGANLQYSVDGGNSWTNVGAYLDPNNWYNDNTIVGNPGGSQEGWTNTIFTSYLVASHTVPAALYGEPVVHFRVNFGSDGSVLYDGVAFDDFAIGYEDTIEYTALPDYTGCGPVTLDYGSTPGFYNYKMVDPVTSAVEGIGAQYNGQIVLNNTSNVDTTYYFILHYVDASGLNQYRDTVLVTINPTPFADLDDTLFCSGFPGSVDYMAPSNPNYTYAWNNGATTNMATYTVSGPVQLDLTHTISGCTYTATALIHEGVPVSLPATHVCTGSTVQLDAGNGYTMYDWSTNETTQMIDITAAGTYSVSVEDSMGCTSTDMVVVTESLPMPAITGAIDTLCDYNTVTLNAGAGFASYDWSTGGSAASETIDGSTLPLGSNTITVTVTDADGCSNSDDVTIIVDACVSLDELAGFALSVYPNPTSNQFVYEMPGASGNVQVVIMDLSGKVVYNSEMGAAAGTIDLSNFDNGVYLVNFQLGTEYSSVRVIKQ